VIDIIVVDNEFSYFNEFQKAEYDEAVEIGYTDEYFIAVTDTENKTDQEIKDFLFSRKIRTKYGKLQRASDSHRV
jgi:hypothetical protein